MFNQGFGKTFVAKREEVTGGWGKLHSRWFHDLYNLSLNTLVIIKPEIGWCMCHIWWRRYVHAEF